MNLGNSDLEIPLNAQCTLLVWDALGSPPEGGWFTVLWRSFEDSDSVNILSIPKLVEEYADSLRARYLAWIYELGETHIHGRRVVDHLELRPGFSYWWMTLFAGKCNYAKSPQITDAIRLMAFESWATSRSFGSVVLVSANQSLAECVRSWCARLGVAFEWRRVASQSEHLSWVKRVYQAIPHTMQAFAWLTRYLIIRWPLRGVGLKAWCQTAGQVTFFSYLFNLVPNAVKDGRYESRYWAHLPDDLKREGCKTNWLHLYVKDALLPTAGKAAEIIRQFNKTGQVVQEHATLDAFLGARVIVKTLLDWGRLAWAERCLRQSISSTPSAGLDLWPLFEESWRQSMFGSDAIRNVLYLNLLESALKSLPNQRVGVYLQENQGWEMALNYAWKAAGHGRLIGTPHSTVRFWDLRYFFDPRSYCRKGGGDLPLPDKVAFNGVAVLEAYQEGGYPLEDMVEVEALRYLHLCKVRTEADIVSPPSNGPIRVLVLGDYLLSNTQQQMRLLEKAVRLLPQAVIITVKPHPNCPVRLDDYPMLRMDVTMEPISKLLGGCDVAYTSSVTSAAVDACCAGVPVVSVLDPNTLNQSPLRGREGVLFTSTPEELASALISAASSASRFATEKQNFFTLDPKLTRWKKLLLETQSDAGGA